MSNKAFILRGISGTGKGTRLSSLMEFLRYKNEDDIVPVFASDIKPNKPEEPVQIGVLCKSLNLFFAGKWVRSNKSGMYSWSSMDGMSQVKSRVYWTLLDYVGSKKNMHLIAEGYFAMKGSYFGANKLVQYGFSDVYYLHYLFENKQELMDRCYNRSGSVIKGAPWPDNSFFSERPENKTKTIETEGSWYRKTGGTGVYKYNFYSADEPAYNMGVYVLNELGESNLAKEYEEWGSDSNNLTYRDIGNKEANVSIYQSRVVKYNEKECMLIELPKPKEQVTGRR